MEQTNKENTVVEYTMGFGEANLIAFFLVFPITVLLLVPFVLLWTYEAFSVGFSLFMNYFIPLFIGGIIVHELLHGLTWLAISGANIKSLKFGVKFLTPYCHCKVPMKVKHYWLVGAMPLIVMGLIPSLIAMAIGDGVIMSFGLFFSCAAGGDILILYKLRKLDRNSFVSDHPEKVGFYQEIEP